MMSRRERRPRFVVTMGFDQAIHDWLRDEAAAQLGDDRHIGKIISALVRVEMEKKEQEKIATAAD